MANYSVAKQNSYWALADDTTNSSTVRGRALEGLAAYLFGRIPGVKAVAANVISAFQSEEIDVAVDNERRPNGLYFLPPLFLVECKNWSRPTGSAELAWFDWKVRVRGQKFGVFITTNGITGNPHERTGARDVVASALTESRQLLVLQKDDLSSLVTTEEFLGRLQTRVSQLVLYRTAPPYPDP